MGSVKPNIGHLEAAAGVASIIKGVLAMERGLIPPSLNFSKANPAIPLDEWKMAVPTKLTPWPASQVKRMSISGFGMGGTNAHLVLEAFNDTRSVGKSNHGTLAMQNPKKRLFVFSSNDKAGFKRLGDTISNHLDSLGSAASSSAYLANLAYTLAVGRSGLTWKATCTAENAVDLREQLQTTLGEDAVRPPGSSPRIGFVFTGQGAQWARMGMEMMDRPVFSESVAKSTELLTEMGCDWDPVTELAKEDKVSRLGVPEVSQPICSVLQIALVDELRSWGVTPSKVVGHSSGEIAAAYTMGALSHRDALFAAYFRGVASARLRSKEQRGGMMAVGLSRDEAEAVMEETDFHVRVACVNAPASVTLSGDVSTLESLRAALNERNVFARRLKVDVAYHSSQMHLCSAEYFASIDNLGQTQAENADQQQEVTMISSVTGSEIDPDSLGAYYWVQNLISPVLFTDAVAEMVSPADADGTKSLDFLLEIGPHGALGGPIEQIISSIGIPEMNYKSMLTRGQNAVDTSLSVAVELINQGVPVNVPAANGDLNCRLLQDLPPYPWNHSEQFRADSRIQRELVSQQHPTKGLIGAALPKMEETERVWRSFIHLNDEPWLRSHTVGSTVLFPGAGMVSLALEAAQQIGDQDKTLSAFKLRDISFLAAMSLSEDAATEVTIHLRPHLLTLASSTPAAWWEFTVSSCIGPTGQMRNNCRGLVSAVYDESKSPHMAHEEAELETARVADYRQVLRECSKTCSKDVFYDHFAKSSLPYGEAFQAVENCHPGVGKSAYEVKVVDVGETFSDGKLERPFLIHVATLDAILQGWLASTCEKSNDDFGFNKPMLPSAIGELEISLDMPADVGYMMPGYCRSHKHGFSQFSADINVFDKDLSKVLMSISDFRLASLDVDDAADSEVEDGGVSVDPANITAKSEWNYALDLMEPAEISRVLQGAETTTTDERLAQVS